MKHFYIDTKTISDFNFLKAYGATKHDEITLFFEDKSMRLNADSFKLLLMNGFSFEVEDVKGNMQDALYLCIISKIATSISDNNNDRYYIVSDNECFREGVENSVEYLIRNTNAYIEVIGSKDYIDIINAIVGNSDTDKDLKDNLKKKFGNGAGNNLYCKYKDNFIEK